MEGAGGLNIYGREPWVAGEPGRPQQPQGHRQTNWRCPFLFGGV